MSSPSRALTLTPQGDGLKATWNAVTGATKHTALVALAALVPAGPAQAQTITGMSGTPKSSNTALTVGWSVGILPLSAVQTVQWKSSGESYSTTSRAVRLNRATRTYTIGGLNPNTQVTVRVRVLNNNQQAGELERTFTMPPTNPNITVTNTGFTSARVTWTPVGEVIKSRGSPLGAWPQYSYDLYYKSGSESYSWRRNPPVYTNSNSPIIPPYADLKGLTRGKTYTVRVRSYTIELQFDDQGYELNMARRTMTGQSEVTFTMGGSRRDVLYSAQGNAQGNADTQQTGGNTAPVFVSGTGAQSVTAGTAFSYTVPEARDNEGDTIIYTATLYNGDALPAWLTFNESTRTLSGTPAAGDTGALDLAVRVTDDGDPPLSASEYFTLTVKPAGVQQSPGHRTTKPTANAGGDQTGQRGGEVKLKGAGTLHPRGSQDPLTYTWRIIDASHPELKAGASWLTDADQATATWSVPRRKDVTDRSAVNNRQWITFELTVTDGDGETATDTVTVTIQGSTWKAVSLSVADATAEETSGAVTFTVSLSTAVRDPVTVNYATSNGTALAGVDYTAASGALTFPPGQTSKTVTVAILGDEIDEGTETFTFTLSDPLPSKTVTLAAATATGTIKNKDPLPNAWLSRFGRSVASQTMAAVAERLALPAATSSRLTLAGQRIEPAKTAASASDWLADLPQGTAPMVGTITTEDLLLSSNFHLASSNNATDPSSPSPWRFAGWGQAGMERFENRNGGLPVNADVLTGVVGADVARGHWLAGAALSVSRGEGEMRPRGMTHAYDLESTMTALNPYLRLQPSERFSAWGMAGWGWGHLTLTQQGENEDGDAFSQAYNTDLAMTLAALGGRAELLTPSANGGFALALKGDAFFVRTRSDAAMDVDGLGRLEAGEAEASRLRLTLEGSRPVILEGGAVLTPSLEMGVRQDGGDAETGTGLEVGAALAYDHPASGVSADLKARTLLVHADSGYREWGLSGALRVAPGEGNRGLSLSLLPAWGRDGSGIDQLWTARDAVELAASSDGFEPSARLEAELGYGLPAFSDRFTATPYLGLGWADATRSYRIGWRLTPVEEDDSFQFSLEAQRRQSASQEEAEHQLGLNLNTLW